MGTKYQPHAVRHSQERRISARESLLDPKKNPLCFRDVDNYDQEIKKVKSERAQLSRITPPVVSDAERPILLERKKQLEKALVAGNKNVREMPSQRQMEDNPDGSTSHYLGWERSWATNTVDPGGNLAPAPMLPGGGGQYGAKFELKDIQYRLKAEQGDLAIGEGSLEYLRGGQPEPLMNQHTPVSFGLSEKARAHFDGIFPDYVPTDVEVAIGEYTSEEKAEREEAEEIKKVLAKMDAQDKEQEDLPVTPPNPDTTLIKANEEEKRMRYTRCHGVTAGGHRCKRESIAPQFPWCHSTKHRLQIEDRKSKGEEI